ncbi:hypothetical protein BDR04DRAFT_1110136 [Suillus decipiens]|nr:hypothetical protein BDR04DRAFT_1110136 [Suillus decipiens]
MAGKCLDQFHPYHEVDGKKHREKGGSTVKKICSNLDCSHHVAIEKFSTGTQEYFPIFAMSYVTDQDHLRPSPHLIELLQNMFNPATSIISVLVLVLNPTNQSNRS